MLCVFSVSPNTGWTTWLQRLYYASDGCIPVFLYSEDSNNRHNPSVTLSFDDVIPWEELSENMV